MSKARFHLVTAAAAALPAVAGTAIFMWISGEKGGLEFLGWVVWYVAIVYPSLIASMRSERPIRCTIWLKRLATGAR